MAYCQNQSSLWGSSNDKYIKFYNSSLVAIDGSATVETQLLDFLRIRYSQIMRARITLKPGQIDYFLNYASIGDGASFVSIVAKYDPKSKIEADNYVNYTFYNDMNRTRSFCEVMILTGNSITLIPQLYLTNPNQDYAVILDVMIASKSDDYNFFVDTINQTGTSFVGLSYSSIQTYVVDDIIQVVDSQNRALMYINIDDISQTSINGLIIEIDDNSKGLIFLKFVDEYSANQAFSLLEYIRTNDGVDTEFLIPLTDDESPVIYFYDTIVDTSSNIILEGSTFSGPYNTSQGLTFSATMSLGTFGTISNNLLVDVLIGSASDNRDGIISVTGSDLVISKENATYTSITSPGTYSITFDGVVDFANNNNSNVLLTLTIIS